MIVGTAGHIDHGKSTLVKALTGVDPDRLKEEKERGITIDLGFAYAGEGEEEMGFVDVPGHERLVHTMLAGAHGVDVLLLVVAADDGVMPQTREHLAIAELLGLTRAVVALTKIDRVPVERLGDAQAQTRALLQTGVFASAPIYPVSAISGEGLDSLRTALRRSGRAGRARSAEAPFRLAVDRSFTLAGVGTVVTGTVIGGAVSSGDRIVLSPSGRGARVRGIRVQNRPAQRAAAGDRAALNLAGDGISKDAIRRGDMAVDAALHAPASRLDVRLRLLSSETRAMTQWMPVRMHHGTAEVGARVVLLGDEPLAPGGEAFVQLVLERPIAVAIGDRFVLRDTSAQRTIGGGAIVDQRAPARRRRAPERLAQLDAMARPRTDEALLALLALPPYAVDVEAFVRDRAIPRGEMDAIADEHGLIGLSARGQTLFMAPAHWLETKRVIVETLASFHADNPDLAGIGLERLRQKVAPRMAAPGFAALLADHQRTGTVALDGSWVKLPGHVVRLTPQDEALWDRILSLVSGEARFKPPRVRDIAAVLDAGEPDVRRVLKSMSRMGRMDEIAHDHFFLRAATAEMVEIACTVAAGADRGEFATGLFRDRLDCGRKVAIFILEFFDRHGVTIRRGDLRRINRHRLDLFRRPEAADPGETQRTGREASPVGRPDFKSGRGRETVPGGFDSHSLPPA